MREFIQNIIQDFAHFYEYLHEQYNIPWMVLIIGGAICLRLLLLPVSIIRIQKVARLTMLTPTITKMHVKYRHDSKAYQDNFRNLYIKNGVTPASPFIWIAVSILPLSIYSGVVLLMFPHLQGIPFPGTKDVSMTSNPMSGEPLAILILILNLTLLIGFLGMGTYAVWKNTTEKSRRMLALIPIIIFPFMSLTAGLFLPMYFIIYILFFFCYSITESKIVHRIFGAANQAKLWIPDLEEDKTLEENKEEGEDFKSDAFEPVK